MKLTRNFFIRALSGIVMVLLLLATTLWSDMSCRLLLMLIAIGSLNEFLDNIHKKGHPILKWYVMLLGLAVFWIGTDSLPILGTVGLAIIVILFFIRFFIELYRKNEKPISVLALEAFAILYTIIPMVLLYDIDNRYIVMSIFIIVWTNDVGAYLVGMTFGRHRLFERISPKKSWEGFYGGLVFAIGAGILLGDLYVENIYIGIFLSVILSLSAIVGDLFESMFKRSIDVKDSGSIIPGHGGFLDRFDAVLFAGPMFYVCYKILTHLSYL